MLQTEQNEVNILSSYLPKQISDEETKKICQETLDILGATEIQDMGKVMGELKKKYADKLDFAKAGSLVRKLLTKQKIGF